MTDGGSVSFIFLGDIYSNWDDIFTKIYDNTAFLNSDTTRIVVKKPEGSEITKEDISCFNNIKYVTMADQYGFADDMLKEKSSQIYFSEELCNILYLDLFGDSFKMSLCWDFFSQRYITAANFVPVIGEGLSSSMNNKGEVYEVRVSPELVLPSGFSAPGQALIELFRKDDKKKLNQWLPKIRHP